MAMIQYVQIKYQNGYILLLGGFFIWLRNYTVAYKRVREAARSKYWLLVLSKAKVGWFCFVLKYCVCKCHIKSISVLGHVCITQTG